MNTNSRYKIAHQADLKERITSWKMHGESIVFTNGCFDIVHYGHIDYLEKASALGDRLIVGINSDASVSRIKGVHRPIQDENSRIALLAALSCVDIAILFDTDTPLDLIEIVQPDILVKGGDWKPEQIVGSAFVQSYGGRVTTLPFLPGYSTTLIEEKIKLFL